MIRHYKPHLPWLHLLHPSIVFATSFLVCSWASCNESLKKRQQKGHSYRSKEPLPIILAAQVLDVQSRRTGLTAGSCGLGAEGGIPGDQTGRGGVLPIVGTSLDHSIKGRDKEVEMCKIKRPSGKGRWWWWCWGGGSGCLRGVGLVCRPVISSSVSMRRWDNSWTLFSMQEKAKVYFLCVGIVLESSHNTFLMSLVPLRLIRTLINTQTCTHTDKQRTQTFSNYHILYSLSFTGLCLALCPSFHHNVTCVRSARVAACRGRRKLRSAAETSQARSRGRSAKVWKLLSVLFTWHSLNLLPLPERPSTCTMLPPSADAAIINEKHAEARSAAAIGVEIRHLHHNSADSMASWGCWVYRGENWPDVCDNVSYILKGNQRFTDFSRWLTS